MFSHPNERSLSAEGFRQRSISEHWPMTDIKYFYNALVFGNWFELQPPLLLLYFMEVSGEVTLRDEPLGLKHLNGFFSSDAPSSGIF